MVRGTELTFTAAPNTYYRFVGWTDALESYGDEFASVTLRVLDNLTVGAAFEPDVLYMLEYAAVSEAGGLGTVTATANGAQVASGTGLVPDTVVDLKATAGQDSRFLKWGVTQGTVTTFTPVEEELVTESTHQIAMSAKSSVDAYFKEIERFDLAVPADLEHGSIVVERAGQQVTPGDDALAFGDVITVSATAEDGYLLTSLLVNGEEFASGDSLTVKGDVSIEVTLEKVHVHTWNDEPTWAWGADNATAEATFACTDPRLRRYAHGERTGRVHDPGRADLHRDGQGHAHRHGQPGRHGLHDEHRGEGPRQGPRLPRGRLHRMRRRGPGLRGAQSAR